MNDTMTKKQAWEFLEEHIPAGAGYGPWEWDDMAEYIEQFEEAYRIVRDACVKETDDEYLIKRLRRWNMAESGGDPTRSVMRDLNDAADRIEELELLQEDTALRCLHLEAENKELKECIAEWQKDSVLNGRW